jgi:hypothetical protein
MIVTVYDHRAATEELSIDHPRRAAADALTVNTVYRACQFSKPTGATARPAVQVGRFLYNRGLFATHSTERTEAGTQWATAVGGVVPDLVTILDPEKFLNFSRNAMEKLRENDWWHQVQTAN